MKNCIGVSHLGLGKYKFIIHKKTGQAGQTDMIYTVADPETGATVPFGSFLQAANYVWEQIESKYEWRKQIERKEENDHA